MKILKHMAIAALLMGCQSILAMEEDAELREAMRLSLEQTAQERARQEQEERELQQALQASMISTPAVAVSSSSARIPQYQIYINQKRPEMQFITLAQDQNYLLGKMAFNNPNGPDTEWLTLKNTEYDPLKRYIANNVSNGATAVEFLDDKAGALPSEEYATQIIARLRNNGIEIKDFDIDSGKDDNYKKKKFQEFRLLVLKMIDENKKALAQRKDKNTEYYGFAQKYVNNMNKEIARIFVLYGTRVYGVYYLETGAGNRRIQLYKGQDSPEANEVRAAAAPVL